MSEHAQDSESDDGDGKKNKKKKKKKKKGGDGEDGGKNDGEDGGDGPDTGMEEQRLKSIWDLVDADKSGVRSVHNPCGVSTTSRCV